MKMVILIGCVMLLFFVGGFVLVAEYAVEPLLGAEAAAGFSEEGFFPAFFVMVALVVCVTFMRAESGSASSKSRPSREDKMEQEKVYHPARVQAEIEWFTQAIRDMRGRREALGAPPYACRGLDLQIQALTIKRSEWQRASTYTPHWYERSRHPRLIRQRDRQAPVFYVHHLY